jgi:hypothetical protein
VAAGSIRAGSATREMFLCFALAAVATSARRAKYRDELRDKPLEPENE